MSDRLRLLVLIGILVAILAIAMTYTSESNVSAQETGIAIPSAIQIETVILNPTTAVELETEEPLRTPLPIITSAPTPTHGAEPMRTPQLDPTLTSPVTEAEALQLAWDVDNSGAATWEIPWTPSTTQEDPGRITIEWHDDISYRGTLRGPVFENQPVWSVTIRGPVFLYGIGWSGKFSGVTYDIYVKSGTFGGMKPLDPRIE